MIRERLWCRLKSSFCENSKNSLAKMRILAHNCCVLFQAPLHKRILSRVVFYSGVGLFLLGMDFLQRDQVPTAEVSVGIEAAQAETPKAADDV